MKSIFMRGQRKRWLLSAAVAFVLLAMSVGTAFAHKSGSIGSVRYSNTSRVVNRQNDWFKSGHRTQLNFTDKAMAMANNAADAYASCSSCDDLSVAVQVDMFGPDVRAIKLNNNTDAVLDNCRNCNVATVALQYVVISDDWTHVPAVVQSFMDEADQLLDNIEHNRLTFAQALAALNALIAKYLYAPLPAAAAPAHSAAPVDPANAPVKSGLHVDSKKKRG